MLVDRRGDEIEPSQPVVTTTISSQEVLFPTVHGDITDDDNGMEYEGHFSVTVRDSPLPSLSSTFGYSTDELADMYNGL